MKRGFLTLKLSCPVATAGRCTGVTKLTARRKRVGRARFSIAAGDTPLSELHPAAVATIVRALRQVGEDHPARLFAIETAIAYGL